MPKYTAEVDHIAVTIYDFEADSMAAAVTEINSRIFRDGIKPLGLSLSYAEAQEPPDHEPHVDVEDEDYVQRHDTD